MTTTLYPASERQVAFITSLLADRVIPDADAVRAELPTLDKRRASALIERLLQAPKAARTAAATRSGNPALAGIPHSKYAVRVSDIEVAADVAGIALAGDLLFVEVKEYRGTVYMRRLTGAPGAFTRSRMPRGLEDDIIRVIAADPYGHTRLFGEHYRCCGKCGAELTDEESRRLMLGPVCRRAFGV